MSELGYAVSERFGPLAEGNWELRWPLSVAVFAKMSREDAQVRSVLSAVTLPIRRATWRLDPNGAPEEIVAHVAEDLRLPVLGEAQDQPVAPRRGRVSWSEHVQKALLALRFGHMFFEQVYAPGVDGREHLVKLAPRMPDTLAEINVALDGGLSSIKQKPMTWGKQTIKPPRIPVGRLVAYIHEPDDSSWLGTSILRAAFKHWRLRDELLRVEVLALDRNGMGVPVYVASELTKPDAVSEEIEAGEKLARAVRSGDDAGVSAPPGAKFDIKGTSGQLASPREAITYHDSMMAKSVLAHFLNLEGKGGSYALADTQADLFVQSVQTTAEWLADTATQHIVEDLVRVAFPGYDGMCPRIVFDPIASKKELTAEALALLTNAGVIQPDKDLEEEVRRRSSLPSKRPKAQAVADGSTSAVSAEEVARKAQAAKELVAAGVPQEDALTLAGFEGVASVPGEDA